MKLLPFRSWPQSWGSIPDAQATIDEYNTACETGEDPLGKGKKALFPCKEAFYRHHRRSPPVITTGGLPTSVDAEVLNPFDEPISRPYAAGEVTGGGVGYPGCGTAIAECIIFWPHRRWWNAAQLPDW